MYAYIYIYMYIYICNALKTINCDSLRAGRSGDRVPVVARFSAAIETGSEAHPASCTMGTGSFPGARRPGRGADHPPPSSAEVHRKEYSYTSTLP